ncbi:MAG: hypothetical protein AAGI08_02660, partial [Bacteroidota bacterium]
AYAYVARDVDGTPVVSGTLRLVFADGDGARTAEGVSGTWAFEAAQTGLDEQEIGPQLGMGSLEGGIGSDGEIWINLNPGLADNNVFLSGRFTENARGELSGTWSYSTFVGSVAGGTFAAER